MAALASLLVNHREAILQTLSLCKDNWNALTKSIDDLPGKAGRLNNEETWTFLTACAYAICGNSGVEELTRSLTGSSDLPAPPDSRIWLEYRPMTPRIGESRTHLDLAVGAITAEPNTRGGIELACHLGPSSWVCFCEMKWESDISSGVSNDKDRNQLVRIAESALYFQTRGLFANKCFVTLVTPAAFKNNTDSGKLYHQKFNEYATDCQNVFARPATMSAQAAK